MIFRGTSMKDMSDGSKDKKIMLDNYTYKTLVTDWNKFYLLI